MVVVVMVRLADGGRVAQQWNDLGTGIQLIVVSVVVYQCVPSITTNL